MSEGEKDVQQELLREVRAQTQLLTQINWLLWAFAALSLLAGCLVVIALS